MNDVKKTSLGERVTTLQSVKAPEQAFKALSELIEEQSQATCETVACSPFDAWWQTSCRYLAPRQISIALVDYDGSQGSGEEDESIVLINRGPMIIDLGGWRLNAGDEGQDMMFPSGTLIKPKEKLTIHTRRKGEFSFNSPRSIWNNKGDTAYLYDNKDHLVCAFAYGLDAHENVAIAHINFDGKEVRTEGDEYVEIGNTGEKWLDISGWQISAGKGQNFNFPEASLLAPKSTIRVYTNQIDIKSGGYSFASKTAVWNNQGDTAVLVDHKDELVSKLSYGNVA